MFGECNAHHLRCKQLESFAVEEKTMNEPSTNPIFVVLLFILRCFVPLAILFGISYLLRRMGLVAIESPETIEEPAEKSTVIPDKAVSSSTTLIKKTQKRKVAPPSGKKPAGKKSVGKKPASKPKTGNSRSRSK
jgi:hypothetical protein